MTTAKLLPNIPRTSKSLYILGVFLISGFSLRAQSVSISSDGSPPDASAAFEVKSSDKGMAFPRLTSTQRDAISSPSKGLIIYNTSCGNLNFYNGTAWKNSGTPAVASVPVVGDGNEIETSSFKANWQIVAGATVYHLDVATDQDFTNFVAGFNNRNVGNTVSFYVSGLSANTDYWYRVRAENNCGIGNNSEAKEVTTSVCPAPNPPVVSAGSNISQTEFKANWQAVAGATTYYIDVATDASFTGFVDGFNNKNVGNAISYDITDLTCDTEYWYRVRAENACSTGNNSNGEGVSTTACGWFCGSAFVDARDSKSYGTVQIGDQCWMKENLNHVPATGSWCYDNLPANCNKYGRLYNWATAMAGASSSSSHPSGVQGICPNGWHLPSASEWDNMGTFLSPDPGYKMKSEPPAWNGSNTSGFSALWGGIYSPSFGSFMDEYSQAHWWTSEESGSYAKTRKVKTSDFNLLSGSEEKSWAASVRCVKD